MRTLVIVGSYLINLFFNILLSMFWIRVFLRYFRVSTLHPVSRLINQVTAPFCRPLEWLSPAKRSFLPRYDWQGLILIVIIEIVKISALWWLLLPKGMYNFIYFSAFVFTDLVIQPCDVLFYLILIHVIMSWVNPNWKQHPVSEILRIISAPLLKLGRWVIPNISGFDFSPIVCLIGLKTITLFLTSLLPFPLI